MFARLFGQDDTVETGVERGFDSFEVRLGDMMRGERATLGKSLLDVQRELRIKAAYIAAIEDCDVTVFETKGFIAGYVRSYARYLGMDPEWTFEKFCLESGFTGVQGISGKAEQSKSPSLAPPMRVDPNDVIATGRTPFVAPSAGFMPQVEPGAIGSFAVLIALVVGLGYGGWSVLQEVQRVQVAPVEAAPELVAEIADPLQGFAQTPGAETTDLASVSTAARAPSVEALDRLYRPQALEVPILVPRDAPISTIEPGALGALALPDTPAVLAAVTDDTEAPSVAQALVAEDGNSLKLVAVRPAWVRVSGADGSVIFEKILDAGETYVVPETEAVPTLHAGNSGSVYFLMNGQTYGPAGSGTSVARGVALSPQEVAAAYTTADPEADRDLGDVLVALATPAPSPTQE